MFAALAWSCGSGAPGYVEYDCVAREVRELAAHEPTPAGISAAEILTFARSFDGSLQWMDGSKTVIRVAIAPGDRATWLEMDGDPADGAVANEFCPDSLAIPARLTVRTDDGALDEIVEAKLVASGSDLVVVSFRIPAARVAGRVLENHTPPDPGAGWTFVEFDLSFTTGWSNGDVSGTYESSQVLGMTPIASWNVDRQRG